MQIHEVVDDATLQVVLDAVDNDLLAGIHDLEIGVFILVSITVNRLVDPLVMTYAVTKILSGGFRVLTAVVGACGLDITDIGHYGVLIVAFALDKEDLYAVSGAYVGDPFATVLCGIGSVKNGDDAA
jgi:hypothetical protein